MRARVAVFLLPVVAALLLPTFAAAQVGGTMTARLRAFDEVPALSSVGVGHFSGQVDDAGTLLTWAIDWPQLKGQVTQVHLHFAQKGVNGGIMIFLCSNLGNGPAGTPACPTGAGSISGEADASDVIGPTSQGIAAGDFAAALRAIRAGMVYANVHTNLFPGGEIRGQVVFKPAD